MLPCKKISKNKTRTRRAHQALKPANYQGVLNRCERLSLPEKWQERVNHLLHR